MQRTILVFSILLFCVNHSFAWPTPNYDSPVDGSSQWTGVGFNWFAVAGSQFYELQVDTSANFNSPLMYNKVEAYINSSSSNNDTYEFVSNLFFGQTYHWRVRAWVTGDTSAWSIPRSIITRDYVNLDSPSDGASVWTGAGFDWYAHSGVDFYEIQIDTSTTFSSQAFQNDVEAYTNTSSSNTDTYEFLSDLYFGETYFWRVRAINAVDTSGWTMRSVQTRDFVTPVSPGDGSTTWAGIGFDWSSHHGVDFYEIQIDTSSNYNSNAFQNDVEAYTNTSSSNNDTYEFLSDLFFGATYYWRIRAINAVDTSSWSVNRTVSTIDQVNLSSPSNAAVTFAGVGFDWFSHAGVDFYEIQLDTSMNFNSVAFQNDVESYINTSSSNNDTYEFLSDMFFGTNYYWRVRAINAVDTTAWTTRMLTTRDDVTLNSPSDGASTWTGVGFDWFSHHGIDFYEIQIDTSLSFNTVAFQNDVESYTNTSSSNNDTYEFLSDMYFGETYYWRVRAINAVDTSGWMTRSIDTRDYVSLTSPSYGSVGISTAGVGLDWSSHHGVDFYQVDWDTTNLYNSSLLLSQLKSYINTSNSNNDTYHNTGALLSNQRYSWRVRAINAVDTSLWLNGLFSTGPTIIIPAVPTLLSPFDNATMQTTSLTLDWLDANNATAYECQFSLNSNFNNPITQTSGISELSISNLLPQSTYYWRVRSQNGGTYSNWSVAWSFDTDTCTVYSFTQTVPVCRGDSFVFPDGSIVNNIQSNFTYTSTFQSVDLCDSTINTNINVISIDTSVTMTTGQLTSNTNGVSYQWIDCGTMSPVPSGGNMQSYLPSASGSYAVIVTSNNCTDTSNCHLVIITGSNATNNDHIQIYPIPVANWLTIEKTNYQAAISHYEMYSLTGSILTHTPSSSSNIDLIDLTNLEDGSYILIINNSDGSSQKRLIIKH